MPTQPHIPPAPYDTSLFNKAWRIGYARVIGPCSPPYNPPGDFPPGLIGAFNAGRAAAIKEHGPGAPTPTP